MGADEFDDLVAEAVGEISGACQCGRQEAGYTPTADRWFHDDYLDAAYIVAVRHFGSRSLIATACWGEFVAAVKEAA